MGTYDYFLKNKKFKNIKPVKCTEYLYKNENVKSSKIKILIKQISSDILRINTCW